MPRGALPKHEKGPGISAEASSNHPRGGGLFHGDGLAPTLPITDIKSHLLALLHILLAGALQHGGMQEDILATIIRGHEAEATHLIKPLHGAIDAIGRPAGVTAAAEVTTRAITTHTATRRTTEVTTGRTVAKATTTTEATAGTTAAEATRSAKIAARRTVTKVAPRRTVTKTTGGTKATTRRRAKIAARRAITEIAARRTVTKPTRGANKPARSTTAWTTLQFRDPCDEAPTRAIRTDLAHQRVVRIGLFNARISQGGCMKKHVLPVWSQHKAEALAPVVPLHLGFNQPAFRHIVRHVGAQSRFRKKTLRDAKPCREYATMQNERREES